jgi:hypothetical protein
VHKAVIDLLVGILKISISTGIAVIAVVSLSAAVLLGVVWLFTRPVNGA